MKFLAYSIIIISLFSYRNISAQCVVNVYANPVDVVCGDPVVLSAFGYGQGQVVFQENFNSGSPTGWAFTQQAMFNNPCSPNGVDGTTHIWMGNSSGVPRELRTLPYNFSTAIAGVTICFDMLFATQGQAAPCEGPDEPDEGVYIQFRVGGGAWQTIHYFDPNGGNDALLTNWNNWCYQLPPGAVANNVEIRFFQDNDSGADYDHWGIDNVQIFFNSPDYNIIWTHDNYSYGTGVSGGDNPNPDYPRQNTTYSVNMTDGTNSCTDQVTVIVRDPILRIDAGTDTTICEGDCVTLDAEATVIKREARNVIFSNNEIAPVTGFPDPADLITLLLPCFNFSGCQCPDGSSVGFGATCPLVFTGSTSMNINVAGLNNPTMPPAQLISVCIDDIGFLFGDLSLFQVILTCPDNTQIVLATPGSITGASMQNACFELNATSLISSGSTPYTGNWQSAQSFNNLTGCAGNGVWTLTFSATIDFSNPNAVPPVGFLNGWSITFFDPEISYQGDFTWAPTTNMTNSNTTNPTVCPLTTQTYTLTASDTANCVTASNTVTITVDPVCCNLAFTGSATNSTSCTTPNGAITLTISSGSGNYSFLWSNNATTQNLTGLAPGVYDVTVTDITQACDRFGSFTITGPTGSPQITAVNATDETCQGYEDGTASVTVTGGTAPLNYSWSSGQTGAAVTSLTDLPAGNYSVTVEDANTCSDIANFTIAPGPVCCTLAVSATVTQPDCGQNNGEISLNITGSGSYTFNWSDGATTPGNLNLAAGSFSVTVTDQLQNCDFDTTIILSNPGAPTLQLGSTPETCVGDEDGSAWVTATGSGHFSYDWSNSETTDSILNLASGTYSVTVEDALGCDAVGTVTVQPGQVCCNLIVSATTTDASCNAADGSISVTVDPASGLAPFEYQLNGGGFSSNNTFSNLATGNYVIVARDANQCSASINVFVDEAGNTIVLSVTATDVTCFGDADGTATATVTGGNAPVTLLWSNSLSDTAISGLTAGTYYLTATDQLNCRRFDSVVVSEPAQLLVDLGGDISFCEGESATLSVSGTFAQIDWSTGETTSSIIVTSTENVSVEVTDANGCTATDAINVTATALPDVDAGADTTIYDFENILLTPTVSGIVNNVGFNWNPPTGLSCTNCQNPIASPDSTTLYYLVYTDQNNCIGFDSILITVDDGEFFAIVPNAFTPNGDGLNDFIIVYHEGMTRMVLRIYNRWGSQVFESRDPAFGWDGTFKGKILDPGVFVYDLYAEFRNYTSKRTTGSITLIR